MITINTINHSWYFIKETVIKPNASLTYDETLLNKSETKDLLESVSSERVSLSSEDLIKVQNRYNSFNPGGNVDLSQVISKIEEIYKDDGGGVRSGVLVEEIDERIAADLDITEALSHKASLGGDGKILSEQLPDVVTSPDWSSISSKPTTISGYGITDAYTKTQVDTAISGISGTGGAIPRPKFVGGTKHYLINVWHDYNFGWVPALYGAVLATLGTAGKTWLYPFMPLEDCVVSQLGVHTGAAYAGNIKLGFYDSNSSAKPNNKLFGSSLINTAVGYTLLSVSTGGISVTAGNLYWIALFNQDGGSPQLVHIQNLYPMLSSGDTYNGYSTTYGYVLNQDGFTTQTDLPTFPAAEPFMTYAKSNIAPRLVFKISS